MTNSTHIINNAPTLDDELGKEIQLFSKNKVGNEKQAGGLVKLLQEKGFIYTYLISPSKNASTASVEVFAWVKAQTVAGFPKGVEALIAMSGKAAGDKMVDGRNYSYWYRQPNSVVGAMSTQLKNKEVIDAEIASGKSKPDARTRSPEAIVKEALGKAIAKMQKAESFDLVTMELDDAVKVITKVMNAIR